MCGNEDLIPILDLGHQYLTGVFPRTADAPITCGPLQLVKCNEAHDPSPCGLVQLRHSYDLRELYGEGYGYRSSLNASMVEHLRRKVAGVVSTVVLSPGDIVCDIGSNDGTLLRAYPDRGLQLVGIDPLGRKFQALYPDHTALIPDFFSAVTFRRYFGQRKAKVITAIAMFYDLEDPLGTIRQIADILADDGLCVLEQSYLLAMLRANAYDTVCHEHLEYYGLKQLRWLSERVGLKIVGIELNQTNGGSISIALAHAHSRYPACEPETQEVEEAERRAGLTGLACYEAFRRRVQGHRADLCGAVEEIRAEGRSVLGYGASTKGNVILQYCGFTRREIPYIAEVNADKFGCVTPGSAIPIIPEAEARAMNPDVFLVLPWHFRDNLVARESRFLAAGGKMLFPLPSLEIVGS